MWLAGGQGQGSDIIILYMYEHTFRAKFFPQEQPIPSNSGATNPIEFRGNQSHRIQGQPIPSNSGATNPI